MRFNPKARLDTSRVRDTGRGRSSGGLGGGGMPIPGGMRAGGGIGGFIIIILFVVLTQCLGNGGTSLPTGSGDTLDDSRMADTERYASCQTGEDANNSEDCARVAVENSLYDFWKDTLPAETGAQFRPAKEIVTFTAAVAHGVRAGLVGRGAVLLPGRRDDLPGHDVLRRGAGAAARRPQRRVRGALRAGPRVRPPHPERARPHGQGQDPAGPEERRRAARAAGGLLRRQVGPGGQHHRRRDRRRPSSRS